MKRTARSAATYHLGLRAGEVPPYVLLPGDPERASEIAASWDQATPLAERREFRSFRGTYRGTALGTVSAGIGGPSLGLVVDELAQIGVRTMIRVGSCGAIDRTLRRGDIVVSRAAARFDRTSEAYAPLGYPAVSDPQVLAALESSAEGLRLPARTGVTATVGTFYPEQGRPGFAGQEAGRLSVPTGPALRSLKLLNIEMEMATLFTIAGVFGLRAGGLCTVYGRARDGAPVPADSRAAIRIANEAVRILAARDRALRSPGRVRSAPDLAR